MRNAKSLTETDQNVSRNFGDSEILVQTLFKTRKSFSGNFFTPQLLLKELLIIKPLNVGISFSLVYFCTLEKPITVDCIWNDTALDTIAHLVYIPVITSVQLPLSVV